ncbi:RDD family protein [Streptococcus cuniculi]|uniref:RDD family protein n=1 Tax=Streptococcus cuniculi TaxID=1432788 RepID=A0A4Y9JD23_9STRE|nr:RDD family protein [Streptococcus cuniculi]MBF0777318.1 RDD family protein [Streptococcus cuniculi]TFU98920.1 RDD family protein [Streptococcus cuniculi]
MSVLIFIQRILAALIDMIVIYLPLQFVLFVLFKGQMGHYLWMAQVLFLIYNVVCTTTFKGQTLGKYFAKLQVYPDVNSFAEMGQREAAKLLYFLPHFVGLIFIVISLAIYSKKQRFLHDIVGRSEVRVFGRTENNTTLH